MCLCPRAPAGFFPGVGNKGVWRTEVPQLGQGQLPSGSLRAKPPEADDILSKECINTSSTEQKKHFSTFPEGGGGPCPPPRPCLRAPTPLPNNPCYPRGELHFCHSTVSIIKQCQYFGRFAGLNLWQNSLVTLQGKSSCRYKWYSDVECFCQ